MRLIVSIFLLCCLALAGVVSGADDATNKTSASGEKAVIPEKFTYIFLQEGTGGSFVKDNASGNYTLTITGAIPYTVYFSDRPARDAGFLENGPFLKSFSFDPKNPPNAAVMIREGNESNDMIVVELTSPKYDNASSTLTYTAKILDEYEFENEWVKDLIPRIDKAIPETFGNVSLIIDSLSCPCIPRGDCSSWFGNSCFHRLDCRPCGDCCGN
ncbi:MAG: hypothetical protein ACYDHX_11365 [Methanothrix sp.]